MSRLTLCHNEAACLESVKKITKHSKIHFPTPQFIEELVELSVVAAGHSVPISSLLPSDSQLL